jgi:hypothetical protein
MKNARNSEVGPPPFVGGSNPDPQSIRRLMTEAGLSAGFCLEWLFDRIESQETVK